MALIAFLKGLFWRLKPEVKAPGTQPTIQMPSPKVPVKAREKAEAERECQTWQDLNRLAFGLEHYSGYYRQAAVERCAELRLSGTLPLVALRLNDWVPQVRRAAASAVMAMLDDAARSDQLAALAIVARLRNAGRTDHSEWIAQFERQFLSSVGEQALWDGLLKGSRDQSRICFDLLLKLANAPTSILGFGASSKADIVLAMRSVELAVRLPDPERLSVLRSAMSSHFGSVRRAALQHLLAQGEAADFLSISLLDKHATVRSLAMSCLRAQQFDLKAFYRSKLQSPCVRPAEVKVVLLSLAALGSIEDLPTIKTFTTATLAGVRSVAYSSWFRLAPGDKDRLMMRAYADVAPSVRRFGRTLLERHGAYAPFPDFCKILGPGEELLQLMFTVHSHKWNWLEAIALVAREIPPTSPLTAALSGELRNWIRNAQWARHRPIGNQAAELSSPATILALEQLIEGEQDSIAQLRNQMLLLADA
jgi:hypothetical protein